MRGRKKKWAEPFIALNPDIISSSLNADDPFFQAEKLYLEVGTGKGDFIIGQIDKLKGHYLGLERDVSIAAIAAKKAKEAMKEDIRFSSMDFDDAFEIIKDLRFDGIYLNFSDPWPKKRHHKRRLTTRERLSKMDLILKKDGFIKIKTDQKDLYDFSLEEISATSLKLTYKTEDYVFDEANDSMSEYERQFRQKGNPIYRIIVTKED